MKKSRLAKFIFSSILIFIHFFAAAQQSDNMHQNNYKPGNQKLYDTIVYLDSLFFEAYNTCNLHLEKYGSFFSDSIEFYHDKGGLVTNKQELIDATKRNVCGKVTRELVKGSIEVYPINNYGAIEMGLHKFHNNTEKVGTPSNVGKFVIIWQQKNNVWKITRVISLH